MLLRTFTASLDIAEGRTLQGRIAPYNTPTRVGDPGRPAYMEVIRPGAFTRSLSERGDRIRLFAGHDDGAMPIGKAVDWQDSPDALYGTFELADTNAGRDAAALVRDGIVTGLSIGADEIGRGTRVGADGVVERTELKLYHVGLVPDPAYDAARVLALRSEAMLFDEPLPQYDERDARRQLIGARYKLLLAR